MNKLRYSEMFYSLQGEGRYVGVPSLFLRLFGCNFECAGFGQDRDKSKWLDHDKMPHNQNHPDVKALVDLPVPHIGCDSSFSWGKKWGHLASNEDIETIVKKMDMVKWYGWKGPVGMDNPVGGDLSPCTLQNDGVHLVITGGEPLLKGFQPALRELIYHPEVYTRFVTFETNGTQIFAPDNSVEFTRKFGVNKNSGITWSVSPKLSNSGEKWSEAIRPEALASYNAWPYSYLYLKFVVKDEHDVEEVHKAVREYDHARVNIDAIYLMPETGLSIDFKIEQKVALLALKYGYKYSPRLQINLFGNEWGT
jgi:organic radical activating enzyme